MIDIFRQPFLLFILGSNVFLFSFLFAGDSTKQANSTSKKNDSNKNNDSNKKNSPKKHGRRSSTSGNSAATATPVGSANKKTVLRQPSAPPKQRATTGSANKKTVRQSSAPPKQRAATGSANKKTVRQSSAPPKQRATTGSANKKTVRQSSAPPKQRAATTVGSANKKNHVASAPSVFPNSAPPASFATPGCAPTFTNSNISDSTSKKKKNKKSSKTSAPILPSALPVSSATSNVSNSSSKKKRRRKKKTTKSPALSSPEVEVEGPPPPPPPPRPELLSPGENMEVSATVRIGSTTYDEFECEGDGDCLGHALMASNETSDSSHLREYLAHHVLENTDDYNLLGFGDELIDLTTQGEWCGHLMLQSFSNAYGVIIIVHHMNGDEPTVFQPSAPFEANATGVAIEVLYNGVHYVRLVARQPAEDESSDDEEEGSEDDSFEGEDGSDDDDEDSSSDDDDDKDGHFPTIEEESPSESGSNSVDEQPGVAVEEVSSDDKESSEAEESEDDDSGDEENSGDEESEDDDSGDEENSGDEESEDDDSGDEENSGDERHLGIDEVLSGSYAEQEEAPPPMPTPRAADNEPRRGSPLEMLLSSARSAANRVIEGFNASPSSLLRRNLNQRFEDTAQNRRRSTRDRKNITVFDPSSTR
jgi:hypothetical protein